MTEYTQDDFIPVVDQQLGEEYGYPHEVLADMLAESHGRFFQNVEKHGKGKNWLNDQSRWHIWKACDELFQARDTAHAGQESETRFHMADALNHMLFAMEIVQTTVTTEEKHA